jgi:hypothetical protein
VFSNLTVVTTGDYDKTELVGTSLSTVGVQFDADLSVHVRISTRWGGGAEARRLAAVVMES